MDTVMMDFSDEASSSRGLDEKILNSIVYTTKLDDMKIFKANTTDMTVDTIIDSIIKESKPKLKWKRKRKYSLTRHPHFAYEDLSYHINRFNRKVALIAEGNNKLLLDICKPVKIALEDIKYTLLRPESTQYRNLKIHVRKPEYRDKPLPEFSISRKLKTRIIYDIQHKEADMYSLDKYFIVKEYIKLHNVDRNDNIFRSLKKDPNTSEASCCCWYDREMFLKKLTLHPHETLRFMRKPHKCAINFCCCCCSKNVSISDDTLSIKANLIKPSETPSIWLNKMIEIHTSLPLPVKSTNILIPKSLSVVPEVSKINYRVKKEKLAFLHSTNIDFGGEYYAIGADGQIKLYFKKTGEKDRCKSSHLITKTANNIVGNICCWYKREEFAVRLLALGALPNTVNFIRCAHPCSLINCSCCCKPSNTKKTKVTLLPKTTRHTNDLVTKKVNIKLRFLRVLETPVRTAKPFRTTAFSNANNIISFYVSLSELEMISKTENEADIIDSLILENAILDNPQNTDKRSTVRILIDKTTPKYKTVIECADLNTLTTKELKMLDVIFRAIKKLHNKPKNSLSKGYYRPIKKNKKPQVSGISLPIYPLLLNTQVSVTTDLRNKRFLPPLRAHIDKYDLTNIKTISTWLDDEVKPRTVINHASIPPHNLTETRTNQCANASKIESPSSAEFNSTNISMPRTTYCPRASAVPVNLPIPRIPYASCASIVPVEPQKSTGSVLQDLLLSPTRQEQDDIRLVQICTETDPLGNSD